MLGLPATIWLDVLKTVLATFIGAALAFSGNLELQRRQRKQANITAGNVALVVLDLQWVTFLNVRHAFLKERRRVLQSNSETPDWLQSKPMPIAFNEELRFDLRALGFLLGKGDAKVVPRLLTAEMCYYDLATLVREHNEAAVELQRAMAALGMKRNALNFAAAETVLPADVTGRKKSLTLALLDRFEKDDADYRAAADTLRAALVRRFGAAKVITSEPPGARAVVESQGHAQIQP